MKTKTILISALVVLPLIAIGFYIAVLLRLIGAFLYNLTDFIQYSSWSFTETKETLHNLATLHIQFYEVYGDFIKKLLKEIK